MIRNTQNMNRKASYFNFHILHHYNKKNGL